MFKAVDDKQTYNDTLLGELGRSVAGKALELLDQELINAKNGSPRRETIEAYANAVQAGLAACPDEEESAE